MTLEEQIESAIESAELQRAQGKLSNGNWHYLRAYHDSLTGWGIIQGEEASPCYPEDEYFSRPGAPVTFWTFQETDFGGPCSSGCTWDEAECDEAEYAHLEGDYENYICLGTSFLEALFEAMDRGLISAEDVPEDVTDEDSAKAALIASGFEPFVLGQWSEPVDFSDKVDKAFDAITSASEKIGSKHELRSFQPS